MFYSSTISTNNDYATVTIDLKFEWQMIPPGAFRMPEVPAYEDGNKGICREVYKNSI